MYQVRRVNIGKTHQLDELAHECGRLYSQTVLSFWRTVRHKGIWLKPTHLMRWYTSEKLHAHTADACVQAFFASLKSWRTRRKSDPSAAPPWKRKWYFRIEYKSSALHHNDGVLTLSNGKGNAPLVLKWLARSKRKQLKKLNRQIKDVEHKLAYKAEQLGMKVVLEDEYTISHRSTVKVRGRPDKREFWQLRKKRG